MKVHIDKRALWGFVTALFILILLGYFSHRNNKNFQESRRLSFHTTEVLNYIEQTRTNSVKLEELLAKYVLTGDTAILRSYNEVLKKAAGDYSMLLEMTSDSPSQQVKIDSLKWVGRKKVGMNKKLMEVFGASRAQAGAMLVSVENKSLLGQVESILSGMRDESNRLLVQRMKRGQAEIDYFQVFFSVLMVLTFLILVVVLLLVNNSFRLRLMAEKKMKVANQELEAFTYSVSHDLRAPLRSIRGFTEVLKEEYGATLDKEGNRLLDIVIRNAGRMGQLIDDLLDFSRLGRKTLAYSQINVGQMVAGIIKEHTAQRPKVVKWVVGELNDMYADASMMRQVWENLISNAIKYSAKEGNPVIEVGCFPKYGTTVYYIKDNGVGFDMKYSDKLFKVFQRLHGNHEFAGTGVGLALAHRIISKHNGDIWAESKPNEGACFYFYINNPTV